MRTLPVLFALSACDLDTSKESASLYPPCEYAARTVGWDEDVEGVRAEEFVALHAGVHEVTATGPGGDVGLTVVVAALSDEEVVYQELVGGQKNEMCESELEIPVSVEVQTEDGALDERLGTVWTVPFDGGKANLHAYWTFDAADLDGTWTSGAPEDAAADEVRLSLTVDEDGARGAFTSRVTVMEGYVPRFIDETVLRWPAE